AGIGKAAEFGEQRGIHDYVVKHLGAAVEYVRVLLVMRQGGDEVSEIRIDEIWAGGDHLVDRRRAAQDRAHHIDIAVTEFERVAITYGDYVFSRGLMRLQQIGQE